MINFLGLSFTAWLDSQGKVPLGKKFRSVKPLNFLIIFSLCFSCQCRFDPENQDSYTVNSPSALSLDANERLYVSDTYGHHVEVYDSSSSFITKFGHMGYADGEFGGPVDLLHHSNGNLYVVENRNNRIQVFNAATHKFITSFGSGGDGDGEFVSPRSIAIDDTAGEIYVADSYNHRIQVFDAATHQFINSFGSEGDEDGEFVSPQSIAIDDTAGEIYVADSSNNRIQVFNASSYAFIASIGSRGREDGEFFLPRKIAIDDTAGEIYVVDYPGYLASFSDLSSIRSSIQVFTASSRAWARNFVINVPSSKRIRGAVAIQDIAVANQKLYILDVINNAVHTFRLTGEYLQSVDLVPIFDFF